MKIGTSEYWGKAQIHTGSCKLWRSAEKAKKEIHSYKSHTPGRPVTLKEILHTFKHSDFQARPQHCVTPWLLSSWKLKGQYIQAYKDQYSMRSSSDQLVAPFPDKHSYEQRAKRPVSNIYNIHKITNIYSGSFEKPDTCNNH